MIRLGTGAPMVSLILKTPRDLEKVVATRILEIMGYAKVNPKPYGYEGIVFVENVDPLEGYKLVRDNIPEVEKILPIFAEADANLSDITEKALEAQYIRV